MGVRKQAVGALPAWLTLQDCLKIINNIEEDSKGCWAYVHHPRRSGRGVKPGTVLKDRITLRYARGAKAVSVRTVLAVLQKKSVPLKWFDTCGNKQCCNPAHLTHSNAPNFSSKHRRAREDNEKERFLARIEVAPNGCWEWTGAYGDDGYPRFYANKYKHQERGNRAAVRILKGKTLDDLHACHECDNKKCVNPDHIWGGTHADNMADFSAKGLARGQIHRGYTFKRKEGKRTPRPCLICKTEFTGRAFDGSRNAKVFCSKTCYFEHTRVRGLALRASTAGLSLGAFRYLTTKWRATMTSEQEGCCRICCKKKKNLIICRKPQAPSESLQCNDFHAICRACWMAGSRVTR